MQQSRITVSESSPVEPRSGPTATAGWGALPVGAQLLPYDVRLQRELTHRRLAVSMVRRLSRVLSLHMADGMLVAGLAALLALSSPAYRAAEPYIPIIVATILLSLNAMGAYRSGDARRDPGRILSGVLMAVLLLGCLVIFPPYLPLAWEVLLALGGATFVALAMSRTFVDRLVRQAYLRGIGLRRAVVLGSAEETWDALRELRDKHNVDQCVVGHLTPTAGDPTALGTTDELERVLGALDVQEVIVATHLASESLERVAELCFERGIALYMIPSLGRLSCRAEPTHLGGCAVLRLYPARLKLPGLIVKRGLDVVLAALTLVLISPLIALIAVAIKLDSPGPVFFLQQRVGLGGRLFTMWKFRSMTADAEQRERELVHLNIYGERGAFKVPNDPRITRVGRFLRRTSLDELPQLINILRGEMSLVGPRPSPIGDLARYAPHHFERLSVVPGLTGPWQVSGRNLITDFETILTMERAYIRDWSLLTDAKILLRTVKVVLTGEGAY